MAMIERYYGDRTHKRIVSAIRTLADYEPLSVTVPFRGCHVVSMDGYDIQAYKVGKVGPQLTVRWEDLTPIEAFVIKRACRYTLDRMQKDAEIRLTEIMRLRETFEKSHFGC